MPELEERLMVSKALRNGCYRSAIQSCKTPATMGLIYFELPGKKLTWANLYNMVKRLERAKLIKQITTSKPIQYQITERGERLLLRRAAKRSDVQYVIGGDR